MNNLSRIMGRAPDTDAYQISALFIRAKGSMLDGLKYYIECGVKLKAVKDSLAHGQWLPWLKENEEVLGFEERAAQRLVKVASKATLTTDLDDAEALEISRLLWGNATGTHGHVSIDRNWYTPDTYIEMAREVMGGIDLDPASDLEAQKVVKAKRFYDKKADGLQQTWQGRIWLNPPWSDPQPWLEKLIVEEVDQAIVLTTNATETGWFQDYDDQADIVCFPLGRIKCYGHDNGSSPLRGQAFWYIGKNRDSFYGVFKQLGLLWVLEK